MPCQRAASPTALNFAANDTVRTVTAMRVDLSRIRVIATTKLINCGHNCNATQVLLVSQDWPLTDKLVAEVGTVMREAEPRPTYYPGSDEKTVKACHGMNAELLSSDRSRVLIPDVDPRSEASILQDEVFTSVIGVVRLPGKTPQEFLRNAIEFSNDVLPGTLAAVVVIDPKTRTQNTATFDEAIASLRYGAIGVNVWPGIAFALGYPFWGAFPGNTPHHIGSGTGVVHNAFLLPPTEDRHRDPVPPVTALHPPRRADALTEAGLLHHQQNRPDDGPSARQVPRRRQPHRAARDLCVRPARLSSVVSESNLHTANVKATVLGRSAASTQLRSAQLDKQFSC
jgi:hypothetical protein